MLRQLQILCEEKHTLNFFRETCISQKVGDLFFLFILYDSHYRDYNAETLRNVINEACIIKTRKFELESVYIGLQFSKIKPI